MIEKHKNLVKERCSHCGHPVYAEQGYQTITEDHYDCHRQSIGNILIVKKRTPAGQGKQAKKIEEKIIYLVEQAYAKKVVNFYYWFQPPVYRGEKQDLAQWGANITIEGEIKIQVYSWCSMKKIISSINHIKLMPDGFNCFEV